MRIVLLAALAAFSLVAKDTKIDEPKKDLRLFYLQNCARCHGEDGSATRPDGKKLGGRDFTSEKDMKGETDESMAKTIRKGIFFGAVMPSFKKKPCGSSKRSFAKRKRASRFCRRSKGMKESNSGILR
jgi:mono/diheme cytochrome c family protein